MKKISLILFSLLLFSMPVLAKKNKKPVLFLTAKDPSVVTSFDEELQKANVFRVQDRIYFTICMPNGFKSDYIKYQIVKQDDNAHVGGFTRVRNITKRINNKNSYSDYFVISLPGKYYLQIFDIQNLHQWLAIEAFRVVDE